VEENNDCIKNQNGSYRNEARLMVPAPPNARAFAVQSHVSEPRARGEAEEGRREGGQSSSSHQPAYVAGDIAIRVQHLSKCYQIYSKPHDRLKQAIYPRLQRIAGKQPKQYCREFWALKDVSFAIKKGETVGIIGRNGSGKSTLLQMICGTLAPTSGSVQTNGRIAALLELGSGFNPEFTGRENVYMNAAVLGLSKKETDARFDQIAAFADIGEFIEQPVKTYSSGMYVRLAFAIQANVEPEILIVDEALAVGDAYFVHRCMDRMYQLQESGTSILLVTHDGTAVKRFCSRACWLNGGEMQMEGEASSVVDAYHAHLFELPVVAVNHDAKATSAEPNIQADQLAQTETYIPNIDRRLGNQRARIAGVGLYDPSMYKIHVIQNNSEVLLRYTVRNVSIEPDKRLIFGYSFRNFRGDDIASSSTDSEGIRIGGFESITQAITVLVRIKIPPLYPGSYAFSVGVSYVDGVQVIMADRIINAVMLHITTAKKMHALLSFDTEFEIIRQ
jgi:lipopolysaccharide transport system ATP-binding protein